MNLQLWEGEFNSLTVEVLVNLFVQVKENRPVVSTIYPYAECEVHTTVCQCTQGIEGLGLFEDAFI